MKSIDTIEREFDQSQKRSEERRHQVYQRTWKDRIIMFISILVILLVMTAAIVVILIASGAFKG